jgi:hypothetical protein
VIEVRSVSVSAFSTHTLPDDPIESVLPATSSLVPS